MEALAFALNVLGDLFYDGKVSTKAAKIIQVFSSIQRKKSINNSSLKILFQAHYVFIHPLYLYMHAHITFLFLKDEKHLLGSILQ